MYASLNQNYFRLPFLLTRESHGSRETLLETPFEIQNGGVLKCLGSLVENGEMSSNARTSALPTACFLDVLLMAQSDTEQTKLAKDRNKINKSTIRLGAD